MKRIAAALLACMASLGTTTRGAEPDSPHHHGDIPGDSRIAVTFPATLKAHTLGNMRDHLATLQLIEDSLARGAFDEAAQLAETRLGLTSLEAHGAHEVARYMPQGMQDIGTQMHKAASRFAVQATNAGATGDLKAALAGLADVTSKCVACHAAYRLE